MSKHDLGLMVVCGAIGLIGLCTTSAQAAANFYTIGARYHGGHTRFEDYPFRSGDLTYQAGIEFHEGIGFWQMLLGYTPSVKADPESTAPEIDYIVTPQLNLILHDQGWLAGTGILSSYIKDDLESDWTKVYWQTMIGYQFRFQHFTLDVMGLYTFDKWSNFSDFRFGNMEASAMLKRRF